LTSSLVPQNLSNNKLCCFQIKRVSKQWVVHQTLPPGVMTRDVPCF
jgi:hypothetical protein